MLRDLGMCVIIAAVSCGVGVVVNQSRERPIDWVRRDVAATPSTNPAHGADAQSTATSGPAGAASGESPAHAAADGTVVIDDVIEALTSNTAFFIDARELHDYQEGHLRGAIHLPSSAIYASIEAVLSVVPDTSARVIVYCGGGNCEASHNVAGALRSDFGYTNVWIYTKGWEEVISASDRFAGMVESIPHDH
ncbi:hypothetical protein B7486_03470 [cyanobacterium TDX16]|nr:hypothetical protein B7486_03470 [cyanobacterium TDX16]